MQRLLLAIALFAFAACNDGANVSPDVDSAGGSDSAGSSDGDGSVIEIAEPDVLPNRWDVTFVVTVPPETPGGDGIFISGNQPELGDFDGHGVPLARQPDGTWAVQLLFAPGTDVEYKITRGSWETVEKGAAGEEIDNRHYGVSMELVTERITVASWRDLPPDPPSPARLDFINGVASQFVGPDRDVVVYLPPGYDSAAAARYPVLYMHDGQNLFDDDDAAFGVAWEIDDTASALIAEGRIEPLIVVGIDNSEQRFDEYTPVADPEYGGGNADAYGRFIVEELKPDIDATYRTVPDAAATGIAGSSLGGLVSMYLGLERPDVFSRIGVVSPSVWWADRDIVDRVEALDRKLPLHIWLDIGTAEGGGGAAADARALRDALIAEGWVLGDDLDYAEYPGAEHDEAAWADRVDDILEALFPR